jgi:hypothetical protein
VAVVVLANLLVPAFASATDRPSDVAHPLLSSEFSRVHRPCPVEICDSPALNRGSVGADGDLGAAGVGSSDVRAAASTPSSGYDFVASDGGIFSYGSPFYGSAGNLHLAQPIVGMASTPDGLGYYLVASDGGVFAFGDARFQGSASEVPLNSPIVGMAVDPVTGGYWLVAADGGVFSYDAPFFGSAGLLNLTRPIVGMAASPDGGGYYLVAADGGVFTFGDAQFQGSPGGSDLNAPVVGIAIDPVTGGYWLAAADGGIFAYNASYYGSAGDLPLNRPIVGLTPTPDGHGYWLVGSDGGLFSYGDAAFLGSTGGTQLNAPVVGMTTPGSASPRLSVFAGIPAQFGLPTAGPANSSDLGTPFGVAVDSHGSLYIADILNSVVEKVSPSGPASAPTETLSVIAGIPNVQGAPTPGPAVGSALDGPVGVAVDSSGNVYIADSGNSVVERVTPAGMLSVIAGIPGKIGAPTIGPAVQSALGGPTGLAVDGSGDVYIADPTNNVVEELTSSGMLSVVAGIPGEPGTTSPGPAIATPLAEPYGVAVDGSGDLYIADSQNSLVDKVTPAGIFSVFAGVPSQFGPPTPGPATDSDLASPFGVAVDRSGDLYVADTLNDAVEEVTPAGTLSVVAGIIDQAALPTPGPATSSGFVLPVSVALDPAGNLYIADPGSGVVDKVTPQP